MKNKQFLFIKKSNFVTRKIIRKREGGTMTVREREREKR